MRILRAEIVGFGKYRQRTFDFTSGNQLLYGVNEAGKSTLYQFIQAMLFGFPVKRGNKRDYAPKDGTSFGGRLWLEFPVTGEVCIERYKQVDRGRAKVMIGERIGDERLLNSLLAPLNLQLFQEVFTFQQEQLSQLDALQEKELHDALISLGISGSKQLLEKRQSYISDAQKLFKHKGQKLPLNRKLLDWQALDQKIHEKEQQESAVQNYYTQLAETDKKQEKLTAKISAAEENLTILKEQQLYWTQYEELQRLKKQLQQVDSHVDQAELASFYQEYQRLEQQIAESQEALDKALSQQEHSEKYKFYLANERKITELLQEKITAARLTDEFRQKLQEQSEAIEKLDAWEKTYPWDPTHLPQPLPTNFFEQIKKAEEKQQLLQEQTLKQDWLMEQKKHLGTAQPTADNQQLMYSYGLFFGAAAALLGGIATSHRWLLILAGILLAAGVFIFKNQKQAATKRTSNNELGHVEEQLLEIEKTITDLQKQRQTHIRLIEKSIPDYSQWTDEQKSRLPWYQQDVEDYLQTTADLEKIDQQLEMLDQNYRALMERFNFLQDWLPLADLELAQRMNQLQHFNDEMNELKLQKTHRSSILLSRQLEQYKEKKAQLVADKQVLLKQAGISQPSEIPWWLERMQDQAKAWQRKKELEELLRTVYPEELSAETLQARFTGLNEQLTADRRLLSSISQENQRLQLVIQQLQVDGTLDELYQERSRLQAEIQELALSWGTQKMLAAFISDLTTELSEQQLPQLLLTASRYLALLTDQRYQKISLDDGQLTLKNKQESLRLYELSTGTKDQVIMAIRFGYLALQQNQPICPVIIDDGWLHYDSQRKRRFAALLREFAKKYQVICLSSDAEMVSLYHEYQQPVMEMGENV
ncbi:AAA family ATPase [Enterococcus mediterraneensis]|uniref:AAA family ATPase n=1 Tax=Enterococcus mediterraneensis TaxID=2364791 RepID=UPI000F054CF4|nr:AAA family ATPase [Enterococcus mediterraneensis]